MKGLLVIASVVLLAASAGCSDIYGTDYRYDGAFNFEQLKYYDWNLAENDADSDRAAIASIRSAVDRILQGKGFVQSSIEPHFIVAPRFETGQRLANPPDPYTAAFGPYTAPPPEHYKEGTVELVIVAGDDRRSIWRGTASADLSGIETPEAKNRKINAVVEVILKQFPPMLPRS